MGAISLLAVGWAFREASCRCVGLVGPWRVDFGGIEDPARRSWDQIHLVRREFRRRFGLSVEEVPVVWRNDPHSRVSLITDPIQMLLDLLRIRWRFRRGAYNP